MRHAACLVALAAVMGGSAGSVAAQPATLAAQCTGAARAGVLELCQNVADAAAILVTRAALTASGGNPVPGTASTMGMRIGSMPRTSVGLRVTAASVSLPPMETEGSTSNVSFPLGSINADASVGIYQGMALLPTVGGFGSLDLLGSLGVLPVHRGEGFEDGAPVTWAIGARVGLLRESFTAPGVSVDVMHRRMGRVAWGSPDLQPEDAYLAAERLRVTSFRGTVGKRFFGYGLTGGVAHDRYSADIEARVRNASVAQPEGVLQLSQQGMPASRTAVYGNASLTLLVLNLAIEAGWQNGGGDPAGPTDRLGRGGLFGGLAVRLAI